MAKTVVGLFDTVDEANAVVNDLVNQGFKRNDISVVANDANGNTAQNYSTAPSTTSTTTADGEATAEAAGSGAVTGTVVGGGLGLLVGLGALLIPGIGPVVAAGPLATVLGLTAAGAGIGAAAGGLIGALTHVGVPEDDAHYYAEGVRRGGTLVMVASPDEQAQNAYDIMQTHGAVDIDERGEEYRNSGWKGFDHNAQPYNAEQINSARQANSPSVAPANDTRTTVQSNQGETVLPVVQEELNVEKRQVQRGGARIFTHVSEQPVEQPVSLHEEHVKVDRQAVNRPATDADRNAFQNRVVEVTETAEEPVVAKNARVVEEVHVGKEATDRTETVRDNVRRSDVQVENLAGTGTTTNTTTNATAATNPSRFEDYDADFRNNFNTLNSGATYEQYQPVYQYGFNLANDATYQGQSWYNVEPQIRPQWEAKNPNTWDRFKATIQYAWDKARSGVNTAVNDVRSATDNRY